jgi:tRNA A-37 threonylcarbamoyl transferase component Bud32
VASVPRATAARWIEEHPQWFERGREPLGARRRLPPHVAALTLETGEAIVKAEAVPFLKSARYALSGRPARSHKAFRLALALAAAGARSPRALALIEERPKGLVRRSLLVLEAIDAPTLRDFLLERLPGIAAEPQRGAEMKDALWRRLASEIARLHAAGFRQRDLKAANILVADDGRGGFDVSLIDLEGMTRLAAPASRRVRTRDLARLHVSLRAPAIAAAGVDEEDWRRLVTSYLESAAGSPPPGEEVERVIAETARWARRKERRNRWRRRPIS